ncbi:MAG: hypothetical protein MJD61_07530, partial [Proteobacteria bacterium]|nr:hypothetical protein [Pseudomonadota bacterium]
LRGGHGQQAGVLELGPEWTLGTASGGEDRSAARQAAGTNRGMPATSGRFVGCPGVERLRIEVGSAGAGPWNPGCIDLPGWGNWREGELA